MLLFLWPMIAHSLFVNNSFPKPENWEKQDSYLYFHTDVEAVGSYSTQLILNGRLTLDSFNVFTFTFKYASDWIKNCPFIPVNSAWVLSLYDITEFRVGWMVISSNGRKLWIFMNTEQAVLGPRNNRFECRHSLGIFPCPFCCLSRALCWGGCAIILAGHKVPSLPEGS